MSEASQPPAGWYADPTGHHGQRWWDGQSWSDHVADGQAVASDPVLAAQSVATAETASASRNGGPLEANSASLGRRKDLSEAGQPPAGWYADPTGHHGQRWWDGQSWSDHVADGQAVASDPVLVVQSVATAETASASRNGGPVEANSASGVGQRLGLDQAVHGSDGGQVPKGWPERYESVIAAVLAAMTPEENVRAAWRMRTNGPRGRISDVGLLVLTDQKVIGADQSAKASGIFTLSAEEVANVELVHRRWGRSDVGYGIRLLSADGTLLGTEDSPAELQVFAKGRDPSKWDSHPQGEEDLAEVQRSLVQLLPKASPSRTELDVTPAGTELAPIADLQAHPPPSTAGGPLPPPPSTAQSGSTSLTQTPEASREDSRAPAGMGRAIGSLLVGLLVLGVISIFVLDILNSDCERNGMVMECVSYGGSIKVKSNYNLLILGVAGVFGLAGVVGGIAGIVRTVQAKYKPPSGGTT